MSGIASKENRVFTVQEAAQTPRLEPLFKIGLRPISPSDWLRSDDKREAYLLEKQELLANRFHDVFVGANEVLQSQKVVYSDICDFLGFEAQGHESPPLLAAAQLVQEDLIIMSKRQGEWVLACACVCFPSSWNLREKHLKPMELVHMPVPGFGPGTRNAELIHRIFDRLDVSQPVERMNWSLYGDDVLFHGDVASDDAGESSSIRSLADVFIRTERQTLRKLEETGDIVFTVHIDVTPFLALQSSPDFGALTKSLECNLEALDEQQAAYKGLKHVRHRLIDELREVEGTLT